MSDTLQNQNKFRFLNAFHLKMLAMVLMLCDHAWSTIAPDLYWLTCIGRIAFPIFAFKIAEGFFHTHDRKKYLVRIFLFALISEIPFNYLTEGGPINPFHQNVMFTFCLALLTMMVLEKIKGKNRIAFLFALMAALPITYLLGFLTFVDYFGYGIWMVLVFYVFHPLKYGWLGELICLFYINWEMIGGLVFLVPFAGHTLEIPEQGLAVLALIPIWLYNGKQGPHGKKVQYACYAFYPLHIALLVLLSRILY